MKKDSNQISEVNCKVIDKGTNGQRNSNRLSFWLTDICLYHRSRKKDSLKRNLLTAISLRGFIQKLKEVIIRNLILYESFRRFGALIRYLILFIKTPRNLKGFVWLLFFGIDLRSATHPHIHKLILFHMTLPSVEDRKHN
jgi:hypothetical protein